jgi:VWFA-related protein
MHRRYSVFLGILVLAGMVQIAAGQDKNATEILKVDTRLVSVPVTVSDRNGRYVPGLTEADFTLYQDGVKQNIDFFGATEEPLTIALLIDTSQSTRPVLADIKDSAHAFLKLLMPRDRAMVVSFDYDTHVLSSLTTDKEQLRHAIRNADIPNELFGTTLRDAAFQTINKSFAGLKGRKAVIILTDGKDFGSRISEDELLYSLQETDTLIYTVMFRTGGGQRPGGGGRNRDIFGGGFPGGPRFPERRFPPQQDRRNRRIGRNNERAEEFLRQLSDTTAGRFYTSEDGKLKKTFESIVEELRFQYRLGFYPPEESDVKPLHELKVKVARPDVAVRARSSYRTQK